MPQSDMPQSDMPQSDIPQSGMPQPGMQELGIDDGGQYSLLSTVPGPNMAQYNEYTRASMLNMPVPVYNGESVKEAVDWKTLDLASILPQEYPPRILMVPILQGVSIYPHGGQGCLNNWVDVSMTDAPKGSKPVKLLAIAPTSEQVGCCVAYDTVSCVLLFDPFHDRLILRNDCQHKISVIKLYGGYCTFVESKESMELYPGEWKICSAFLGALVEFKVLGHTPFYHIIPSLPTKRSSESPKATPKKSRALAGSSAAGTMISQDTSSKNPLLNIVRGDVINVGTGKDSYSLKRMEPISDLRDSDVWHGQHSQMSDKLVVVKVNKCGSRYKNATVRSIENWMREVSIHSSLGSHNAILPYLGSDARFLSIYTEHVNSKDLTFHTGVDNRFNGNEMRAWRILGDVASALSFLHENEILHSDIRLANILFDPVDGAVLKGFDHSSKEKTLILNTDAPWYLPPEFIFHPDKRDFASDMWALGIVMMWVLHTLPMPEKQASWVIEDIHKDGATCEARQEATSTMYDWLGLVRSSKFKLREQGGELGEIVETLVQDGKDSRSDADSVLQRIRSCNLC
ncbi:kinase-like domain-containing protein [Xylaria sp. FL1042]|nr:kinase-like domain-containing protein [Xylaria sp. FL1042]